MLFIRKMNRNSWSFWLRNFPCATWDHLSRIIDWIYLYTVFIVFPQNRISICWVFVFFHSCIHSIVESTDLQFFFLLYRFYRLRLLRRHKWNIHHIRLHAIVPPISGNVRDVKISRFIVGGADDDDVVLGTLDYVIVWALNRILAWTHDCIICISRLRSHLL